MDKSNKERHKMMMVMLMMMMMTMMTIVMMMMMTMTMTMALTMMIKMEINEITMMTLMMMMMMVMIFYICENHHREMNYTISFRLFCVILLKKRGKHVFRVDWKISKQKSINFTFITCCYPTGGLFV